MFLMTLFGTTQAYSTKQLAEKNAAMFLLKRAVDFHSDFAAPQFKYAFQKEDYDVCISIWNDYVMISRYGDSLYRVQIRETVLDKPFI